MKYSESTAQIQTSKDIFPNEAWQMITQIKKGEELTIIDVGTPQEYKSLHLEDAVNINLLSRFFKTRLDIMDKTKTYIVYCKVGRRSKFAQKLMVRFGLQNVYNVTGGTLLWEEEGLPFASGTDGVNKFTFCPFYLSIVTIKKIKKIWGDLVSRISSSAVQGLDDRSHDLRR